MHSSARFFKGVLLVPSTDNRNAVSPFLRKIYGLTIVERTLRALEAGGATDLLLLTDETEAVTRGWKAKTGSWSIGLQIQHVDGASPTLTQWLQQQKDPEKEEGLLFLTEPLVLDPNVPKWLRETAGAAPVSTADEAIYYLPGNLPKESYPAEALRKVPCPLPLCLPVRNTRELHYAKRALLKSLVKPTDGWVSRHLNRPISIRISGVLAHTPLTPNQFTLFTGLLGILAGVLLAQGPYWGFMAGAVLFHLTSILDGVDGELARLKFKSSPFGQWLDTIVDNGSYVLGLAGYLTGLFRDGISPFEKVAGAATIIFTGLTLSSMYYYLRRFKKGGSLLNIEYRYKDGQGWSDRLLRMLAPLGKRDLFALVFMLLGLAGQLHLALIFIAVMTAILFGLSIQSHILTGRKMREG